MNQSLLNCVLAALISLTAASLMRRAPARCVLQLSLIHISSVKGVLRGLHFQIEHPQSKLVRVVSGEVFDVAVDLRPDSPTYGKWEGAVLSAENRRQFFVPRGFAHGFLVLSDVAEFCYKCDDVYHPNDEGGLMWNDPEIGIEWPILEGMELVLSEKDKAHPGLKDLA